MFKLFTLTTMITCFVWVVEAASADDSNFINKRSIDQVLKNAKSKGFVGIVAVSSAEQMIYSQGIGDAEAGKTGYNSTTVVDIASVTKQFTGAAVVKLEQEQRLSFTDTLDKFFPEVGSDKGSVTLHQLLTHTAGFRRHLGRDEEAINKENFIKRALSSNLVQPPGKGYRYSNVGYGLLAAVIETVTGQSYEDYLFSALWQPAGMFSTGYFRPNWSGRDIPKLIEPHAGLYSALDILKKNGDENWHLFGNGGVLSTPEDMMKWHRVLMNTSLLSQKSKEKLFGIHVPETDPGYYYGYGWSIVPERAEGKLVWHNGISYFGKAEFWRFPESGLAIFIASHSGTVSPWSLANELVAVIHGTLAATE